MIITAVIALIILAISLCNSLKKRVGVINLGFNLFIAVACGTFFGGFISLMIGIFFVPKTSVLTNTEVLEPVVAGGKGKFLIDRVSCDSYGNSNYVYFTKNKQGDIEEHFIPLKNGSIVFKKGERSKQDLSEFFTNKRLGWFFFGEGVKKVKIILSSEEDIF